MKTIVILATVLLATGAQAQAPVMERKLETERARMARERLMVTKAKPNQIVGKHVTYSGIVVQAIKADSPLQLLNPAAPGKYGSGENSVTRDTKSNVNGLKFLSIEF